MTDSTVTLDAILLKRTPLSARSMVESPAGDDQRVRIGVSQGTGRLTLNAPWFVRGLSRPQLAGNWPMFCQLLRRYGFAIQCPASELEDLPVAAIPQRWGRRRNAQPLRIEQVQTADALEIDLCHADGRWGWPEEIVEIERLPRLIASLHEATQRDTPIGISLPLDADWGDLEVAISSGIDFLMLVDDSTSDWETWAIDRLRRLSHWGMPGGDAGDASEPAKARKPEPETDEPAEICRGRLPLFLAVPVKSIESAVKLLALGATAVALDSLLEAELPKLPRDRSGSMSSMLSGMGVPDTSISEAAQLEATLRRLHLDAERYRVAAGVEHLSALDRSHLIATTGELGELAGIGSRV